MITPTRVDIVVYQYGTWDRIYPLDNPDGTSPDLTGWTGLFQAKTEPGSSVNSVYLATTLFTEAQTSRPNAFRVTIPTSTTGSLSSIAYDYWLKGFDPTGLESLIAWGRVRVVPAPPP